MENIDDIIKAATEEGNKAANTPTGVTAAAPEQKTEQEEGKPQFPNATRIDLDLTHLPLTEAVLAAEMLARGLAAGKNRCNGYLNRLNRRMLGDDNEEDKARTNCARKLALILMPLADREKLVEEKKESSTVRQWVNNDINSIISGVESALADAPGIDTKEASNKIVAYLLNQIPKELPYAGAAQIYTYAASAMKDPYHKLAEQIEKAMERIAEATKTTMLDLQEQSIQSVETDERIRDITQRLKTDHDPEHPRLLQLKEQGIITKLTPTLEGWLCKTDEETFNAVNRLLVKESSGMESSADIVAQVNRWLEEGENIGELVKTAETELENSFTKMEELKQSAIRMNEGGKPLNAEDEEMADLKERTQNLHTQLSNDLKSKALVQVANSIHKKGIDKVTDILDLPASILAAYEPLVQPTGSTKNTHDPRDIIIKEISNSLQNTDHRLDDTAGADGGNLLGAALTSLKEIRKNIPETTGKNKWATEMTGAIADLLDTTIQPFETAKGNILIFQTAAGDAVLGNLPAAEKRAINLLVQAPDDEESTKLKGMFLNTLNEWNKTIGDRKVFEESLEEDDRGFFKTGYSAMHKNSERFQDLLEGRKLNYKTLLKTINPEDPEHLSRTIFFRQSRKGDALTNAMAEAERTRTMLNSNYNSLSSLNYILDGKDQRSIIEIATGNPEKREEFQKQIHFRLTKAIEETREKQQDHTSLVGSYMNDFLKHKIGELNKEIDMGSIISRLVMLRTEMKRREEDLTARYSKQEGQVGFLRSLAEKGEGKQEPVKSETNRGINNLGFALNQAFQRIEQNGAEKAPEGAQKMLNTTDLLQVFQAAKHSRDVGSAMLKFEKTGREIFGVHSTNSPKNAEKIGFFVMMRACTCFEKDSVKGLEGSKQVADTMPEAVSRAFVSYSQKNLEKASVETPSPKTKNTEPNIS